MFSSTNDEKDTSAIANNNNELEKLEALWQVLTNEQAEKGHATGVSRKHVVTANLDTVQVETTVQVHVYSALQVLEGSGSSDALALNCSVRYGYGGKEHASCSEQEHCPRDCCKSAP